MSQKPFDEHLMIREVKPEDLNFIYATWLRGLYHGNDFYNQIDKQSFFKNYQAYLDRLFRMPAISVRVAAFQDDPDTLVCYGVFSNHTLHWIFTKPAWRKMGIAKRLLGDYKIEQVSHLTKVGKAIKPREWKFNPFAF